MTQKFTIIVFRIFNWFFTSLDCEKCLMNEMDYNLCLLKYTPFT